ncbi:MAG: putative membrane-bound dehydrogenase-like protein [Planctomycetota bacterium]|jgi:putative membrane-bound dehydrogenase-like protein
MTKIQRAVASSLAFLFLALNVATGNPAMQSGQAQLRVFIRAGEKTHGPGQHDHPRFLGEWTTLLTERGAKVSGALQFPSEQQLTETDVLVMYAAEAATIKGEQRELFEAYLERGGGLVVVHDAVCGTEPEWFKTRAGGAWEHGHAKWKEGEMGLYFTEPHPITRGVPHFDLDDEIYFDMHLDPKAKVLANSFHDVYSITPQMWVLDEGTYRAFVTLQGHNYATFNHPAFRTLLLRAIAWAGHRDEDSFTEETELRALRYPPGGPTSALQAHDGFQLNEAFEISLVASEPLIVNPICIDWDDTGRLWVAQTPGYPNKSGDSGLKPSDSISVLTDSDGDGRMDQSKTFAENLDLVTSFVFHEDGVIVTQSPEILWLRDTDGDGRSDERTVLFNGFGFGDTHATISNMRWSLDGWIYATQGYSGNDSREVRSLTFERDFGHIPGGIFRFRPDGSVIEPVSIYSSNTWGLDFAPDGELFFTMANGSHLRHVLLSEDALGPNRIKGTRTWKDIVDHRKLQRISKADRAPYVQIDFVGGFTAASGCTIYSGGLWPQEFEGNHFVSEPTVNLVHRDIVENDGLSYTASKPREEEFLASTDPWFRPIQTRVAADGSLYVVDFYNQAAVHNDTRGPEHGPTNAAKRPDRDSKHGRIWRVQHKDVLPQQAAIATASATPAMRIQKLWEGLHAGILEEHDLRLAIADRDDGVRRNAVRVAGELNLQKAVPTLAFPLSVRIVDRNSRVRLAALTALRNFSIERHVVESLIPHYLIFDDDLTRSAFLRLAENDLPLFMELAIGTRSWSTDKNEVAAADDLLQRLASIIARGKDANAILRTLEQLHHSEPPVPDALPKVLAAITSQLPDDYTFGEAHDRAEKVLAGILNEYANRTDITSALLPLSTKIKNSSKIEDALAPLIQNLHRVTEDPDAGVNAQIEAIQVLLSIPQSRLASIRTADEFLAPYYPVDIQLLLVQSLAQLSETEAAEVLAPALARVTGQVKQQIFHALLDRPTWTAVLLDQVENESLSAKDLGPRQLFQLRNHPDKTTAERAQTLLSTGTSLESQDLEAIIAALVPQVAKAGDVDHGKAVFIENCVVCHSVEHLPQASAGNVGPSLTGMGAHGAEHLLPFIIDPNRSLETSYVEYIAETYDGRLIAGVLTHDGLDSITLRHSAGEEEIRREDIESLRSTGRSPMPTGFEELGAEKLRDLLAFICQDFDHFRVIDIQEHCSASTALGLYDPQYEPKPLDLLQFGIVEVFGVPMQLLDPSRVASSNNAIVLKGGAIEGWASKTAMPQRVTIPVGQTLNRIHVLGGISAWGAPYFPDKKPVISWTFNYADGTQEEVVLKDGVHFADWIRRSDVPDSKFVEGLLREGSWGQVRYFSIESSKPEAKVESLTLTSFDNRMAPTFLALTAESDE